MAAGHPKFLHFGWPKITFDHISRHFRSIRTFCFHKRAICNNFYFFLNGRRRPFWMTENHFRSFQINTQLLFSQNGNKQLFFLWYGCRWPFWITENHFQSHFSPFQINTLFCHKMAAGGHFGWLKNHFWSHFSPFQINTQLFFSQNGGRRPFWMIENQFRWHFSPFQINAQLFIFFSQNGGRRPFWMNENQFRSHLSLFQINTQLLFFLIFFSQNILDDRKSLLIVFIAISDQYTTFIFTK